MHITSLGTLTILIQKTVCQSQQKTRDMNKYSSYILYIYKSFSFNRLNVQIYSLLFIKCSLFVIKFGFSNLNQWCSSKLHMLWINLQPECWHCYSQLFCINVFLIKKKEVWRTDRGRPDVRHRSHMNSHILLHMGTHVQGRMLWQAAKVLGGQQRGRRGQQRGGKHMRQPMSIKRPENGSLMGGQGRHIQVTGTVKVQRHAIQVHWLRYFSPNTQKMKDMWVNNK